MEKEASSANPRTTLLFCHVEPGFIRTAGLDFFGQPLLLEFQLDSAPTERDVNAPVG